LLPGISIVPSDLVAGVYQSDSIRGTATGKCFYPEIDVEHEQTELTEKRPGFGKRSAGFQHGVMVK
jgi:hypothetical protein